MPITLAFDVYGTLIDTAGVTNALADYVGNRAPAFSRLWRDKQLEYSFRRGLMQNYRDFSICTRNALDYACHEFRAEISDSDRQALMAQYRKLPAFPDVEEGLSKLKSASHRLFAFSNGRAEHVADLLQNANIDTYFEDIVSVDEIKSFKPDPAVYRHFLSRSNSIGAQTWLVSGNPFDVIGALAAGMRAAWIRRSRDAIFDPWEFEPTAEVDSIPKLHAALTR